MGWRGHTEVGADRTLHTWPEYEDGHYTEQGQPMCWCRPNLIEYANGNVQVVHRDHLDRLGLDSSA